MCAPSGIQRILQCVRDPVIAWKRVYMPCSHGSRAQAQQPTSHVTHQAVCADSSYPLQVGGTTESAGSAERLYRHALALPAGVHLHLCSPLLPDPHLQATLPAQPTGSVLQRDPVCHGRRAARLCFAHSGSGGGCGPSHQSYYNGRRPDNSEPSSPCMHLMHLTDLDFAHLSFLTEKS